MALARANIASLQSAVFDRTYIDRRLSLICASRNTRYLLHVTDKSALRDDNNDRRRWKDFVVSSPRG